MAKSKAPAHARDFENMDDAQILAQVQDDMKASQAFQSQYFDKFREFYKLYRSHIDDDRRNVDRSNLFIPYTFQCVEVVTPKIVSAMFVARPYVTTIALGDSRWNVEREERSRKMNLLLDYQFHQRVKLVPICVDAIKTALMYGTAITKETWKFRRKKVVDRQPREIMGIQIPGMFRDVLVERVVDDDPHVQVIPLLDFFFDPAGKDIETSRYVIHRYYEDYHELKEKAKNGEGYRNVDKLANSQDTPAFGERQDMLTAVGIGSTHERQKGVEIWEYWTDDWMVKVANQEVVVQSLENPFFHREKPFSRWIDTPVPDEFYGIGEIEPIMGLQEELNVTRNQRIDNVALVLNRMYTVLRTANIDPSQLISRPGGFIEVDNHDDVKAMDIKDITASSYNEEGIIKDDIDKTLGVFDSARGSEPSRRETATTMSILANASSERFRLKVLLMEQGGMKSMVEHIIRMNQQFIDRERELLIVGNDENMETLELSPEEIMGEFDIAVIGSATNASVSKEVQQMQLMQLLNILANNPMVDQSEFLKRIFEAFEMKNIPALLPEQEIQPMPEEQMDPGAALGDYNDVMFGGEMIDG